MFRFRMARGIVEQHDQTHAWKTAGSVSTLSVRWHERVCVFMCVFMCVFLYRHVHALVSQQFVSSVRQLVKNRCCVCTQSVRRFLLPKQCHKTGMWLDDHDSCLLTKFLSCNMQLVPPFSASQYSRNIKDPFQNHKIYMEENASFLLWWSHGFMLHTTNWC